VINQVLISPLNQLVAGVVGSTTVQKLSSFAGIHTLPSIAVNASFETAKYIAKGDNAREEVIRNSLHSWLQSDTIDALAKKHSAAENIDKSDLLQNYRQHASNLSELEAAQVFALFLIMFEAERALNDVRYSQQVQALHRFRMEQLLESKGSAMGIVLDSVAEFHLEPRLKEIKSLIDTDHILGAQELLAKIEPDLNADTKSSVRQLFHMYRGICHLRRENFASAKADLELATKIDAKHALPWINLAHLAFAEENISEALRHSSTAFAIEPEHKSIITTHLACLLAAKEENQYHLLLAKHPDIKTSEEFQLMHARVMLDRLDYQQTATLLKPLIDAQTKHASAYFMMARALFGPLRERVLRDPPITGQLPDFEKPLLAEILKCEDQSVKLLKACEHGEPIAISLLNRGAIKSYMQDIDGAIEDCKLALHYDETRDDARINLARAYIILDRFKEAEEILTGVTTALLGEAAFLRIEIHCRRGEWQQAEPYLDDPYCNQPSHPLYVVTLSRKIEIKKHLGHFEEAQETMQDLESLVEIQPEAAYVLAHAYRAANDLEQAIKWLQKCKDRSEPNVRSLATSLLGDCLYEAGNISAQLVSTARSSTKHCQITISTT
jgi:tetratricopeptide (TPR) repeat protein